MPQSTSKVSVQRVGDGTYRVNARAGRSAVTGRFVTRPTAKRHPASTGEPDRGSRQK